MRTQSRTELGAVLKRCSGAFVHVGVFSFFINLLMLASPLYMLQVYDRVLSSHSGATLLMLTLMVAAFLLAMAGLEMVRSRILVRASMRMEALAADHLFEASFQRALREPAANRTQALQDFTALRQFLTGPGPLAFYDAPWALLFIVLIAAFHPLLGAVAAAGALVLFVLAWLTERATRAPLEKAVLAASENLDFAERSLRNAEALRAMGMLGGIQERWRRRNGFVLARQAEASDLAGGIGALSRFSRLILQTLMIGIGAWLAIEQEITPGVMIACSILVTRALGPVEQAINAWRGFVSARGAWRRLDALLAAHPRAAEPKALPRPAGRLAVETLAGGPPGGAPTLRGVDVALEPGEVLAVVGPSGSGKSSLARLLVGVWSPSTGKVRLDGIEVSGSAQGQLGAHVGYLPQDVALFDGTVAENIARFGDLDPEKVVEAARKAGVHEMILALPEGYDTWIGEGRGALSGGQRQRIGLARALYGDPVLVVLDEPNANLDDEGEAALHRCFGLLREGGAAVVFITHRPSLLAAADRVMVLREGRVHTLGERDEVAARFVPAASVSGKREAA